MGSDRLLRHELGVIEDKIGKCQRKVEHEGIRGLDLWLGGCMYINRLRSRLPPNLICVIVVWGVKQDDVLTYTLYTGVKRELDGYEGRCGRDKETRTTKLLAERV